VYSITERDACQPKKVVDLKILGVDMF